MWRVLEDAAVLLSNSVHTHMLPETGLRYLWPASLSKEPSVRTGTAELSQICSKDFLDSVFPSGSISDGDSVFLAPAILQAHKLLAGEMDGYRVSASSCFTLPRVASVNTPAAGRAFRAHDVDEGYHTTEEARGVFSAAQYQDSPASTAQVRLRSVSVPNHITTSKPRHQA